MGQWNSAFTRIFTRLLLLPGLRTMPAKGRIIGRPGGV